MTHSAGKWMNGSMDGGTCIWTVLVILLTILLIIVIKNQSKSDSFLTYRGFNGEGVVCKMTIEF
jgi:uncharacterized integral membrane protein